MSGRDDSFDARQERVGRNEALFRTVNKQLDRLNESFSVITDTFDVVCECGNGACVEQIVIAADDYARIRRDATLFILVPGHEDMAAEAVVAEDHDDEYVVVRKHPGGPADLAAETAPDEE